MLTCFTHFSYAKFLAINIALNNNKIVLDSLMSILCSYTKSMQIKLLHFNGLESGRPILNSDHLELRLVSQRFAIHILLLLFY